MKQLTYDDIKLRGKVKLPSGYQHLGYGEIAAIENSGIIEGFDEPIFTVKTPECSFNFGLKYILKFYKKNSHNS